MLGFIKHSNEAEKNGSLITANDLKNSLFYVDNRRNRFFYL